MVLGQNFPVQVIPQAVPPAPIYFSDYANENAINGPLRVQIVLNALTIANREVRLKTYFEGNGIAFESNDIVNGAPVLILDGGIPVILTHSELAPYFKFENITGISPTLYGQAIPEGTYQFCFEIRDALTNRKLSDKSCVTSVVFQNEPPILVLPENRATVENRNPLNIVFQWTPRTINVSNVEYELSIVELWDTQLDPQAAFLASSTFFQTTTTSTTYLYGPADPLLLEDRNYAWRVQAKAKQGTEEIGVFKNQGYSEIFYFGHAQECDLPLSITAEVKGATNANILWQDTSTASSQITVRYRKIGTSAWFENKSTGDFLTIWDLEPGTEYEYQIAKSCAISDSDFSTAQTFRTNLFDDDDSTYNCGIAPDIDITNQVALETIITGDKFTAGDFPVTVTEVSGGSGYFTGKGYVTIPYLKSIKVAVEFTNIFINENTEMAQGNVITLFDPNMSGIIDPWDFFDDIDDTVNGGDHVALPTVPFDITNVTVEGDKIIITGVDSGNNPITVEYEYDENDTFIVQGTNTAYSIDENGNVNEIGPIAEGGPATAENTTGLQSSGGGTADSPSVVEIDDSIVQIEYLENTNPKYGWDDQNSSYEAETYHKVTLKNGGDFYPIHKAVKNGDSDSFNIEATFKNEALKLEDLIFKTVTGIAVETVTVSGKPNQLQVNLKGTTGYRNEEVIITYKGEEDKQIIVGSFFVHHLRPVGTVEVRIVTVNGASMPGGLASIAQEFKTAGADINIISGQNIQGNASALSYTDSGLLRKLPESFRNFANDFKNSASNFSTESYYVFVFDNSVDPGAIAGFMPRGTQFGFVFPGNIDPSNKESKKTVEDVITHELGHGVFGINHPADNNLDTDWAMDKGDGNQLAKRDWEAIGDKGLQLYLFDDDGDGENVTASGMFRDYNFLNTFPEWEVDEYFGYLGAPLPFLTPTGETIILPNDAKNVEFFYGYYGSDKVDKFQNFLNLIPGTIRSFELDDTLEKYVADMTSNDDGTITFNGYVDKSGNQYDWNNYTTQRWRNGYPVKDKYGNIQKWNVTGFTYAIMALPNTSGDLELHKFDRTGKTNDYKIGAKETKNILDLDFIFKDKKRISTFRQGPVYGDKTNLDEIQEALRWALKNNNDVSILMLLIKIAEIKSVYPEIINKTTNANTFSNWTNCEDRFGLDQYGGRAGNFETKLIKEYCESYIVTDYYSFGGSGYITKYRLKENGAPIPSSKKEFLLKYFNFLLDDIENISSNTVDIFTRLTNEIEYANQVDIEKLNDAITYASDEEFLILDGEAILRIFRRYVQSEDENIPESTFLKILENLNKTTKQIVYDGLSNRNNNTNHNLFFELNERFHDSDVIVNFLFYYTKLITEKGKPEDRIAAIEEAVKLKDGRLSDDTEKIVSYLFNNISNYSEAEKVINRLKRDDYDLFNKVWSIIKRERFFENFNTSNAYATNFVTQIGSIMKSAANGLDVPEGVSAYLMKNATHNPDGVDYLNGESADIKEIDFSQDKFALMLKPGFWTGTVNGSKNWFTLEANLNNSRPPKVKLLFKVNNKTLIKNDEGVLPLEYIFIQFLANTEIGNVTYNKGEVIAVPAMYLSWMDYMLDADRNKDAATIAFNSAVIVVSIAGAIPSGGSSLSLLTVAGATISVTAASTSIALVYSDELEKAYGKDLVNSLNIVNTVATIADLPSSIKGVITIYKGGKKILTSGSGAFKANLEKLIKSADGLKGSKIDIDYKLLAKSLEELKKNAPEIFEKKFSEIKDFMAQIRIARQGDSRFKIDVYDKAVEMASNFYFTKVSPGFHLTVDKIKSLPGQLVLKIQDQRNVLELKFNEIALGKINQAGQLTDIKVYTYLDPGSRSVAEFTANILANGKIYKNQLIEILAGRNGNLSYRIKFKAGTKRDGDLINQVYVRNGEAPSYKKGTGNVEDKVLNPGDELYVVEYKGQTRPGSFGSKDPISTLKELREKLAVLKDWKDPSIDDIVIRKYKVEQPIEVRSGPIGSQLEVTGEVYPGGGHQYEFMDNWKKISFEDLAKKLKLIDEQPIK